jgi:DNA-binding transcriptional LysR family regulator
MEFDLRQLEIFCKVVEFQSFSKAAKAVFLAQASVSERISNLEKSVGTKLLDRLGRQVVPTKAGELLYKHAIKILDMKRFICQEMENFLGMKQGSIHLGGSTIPGEYILPEVICRFREKYPLISVTLSIGDSTEIQDRVINGALELGVIGAKVTNKNLLSYPLWEDELVLAVPAKHPLSQKDVISIKDIFGLPFILRESGSGTLKIFEEYLQKAVPEGVNSLNIVTRLGSSTAVKEGIKAGVGVSILSLRAISTEINAGILRAIRIKEMVMKRKFHLIKDKRRTASPLCNALLDFLLKNSKIQE